VAKTRIQAGEEVTDCYGIHHLSIEKATRLSTLQKNFLFNCQCKVKEVGVDVIFQLRRPQGSPPYRRTSSSTASAR
jgi:hypothetical protein